MALMNRLFAFPCPLYQIVELGLIVAAALFPDDKGIGHAVHDLPYHLQTGQTLIQTGRGGNSASTCSSAQMALNFLSDAS